MAFSVKEHYISIYLYLLTKQITNEQLAGEQAFWNNLVCLDRHTVQIFCENQR